MDSMQMMMIIGVVFLIFVGIMGGIVLVAIKKMSNDSDVPTSKDAKTAQDFLPFKDIRDSMIDLGGFEYRAIIECESINYDLKTEQEKEMIDASFQRFLDSLIFPITFHIQTRTIDNTRLLTLLEQEMIETVKEYNHLYDYANGYLQEMIKINETIGNNKHKKKYVIVPFSDSASLTYSSDAEKYEEALKGMYNRCQIVMDGLRGIEVNTKILTSKEIAELLYSTYHRDNYSDIEEIVNGEYMNIIVEGRNSIANMKEENKVLWIMTECENRLKTEIISENSSLSEKEKARELLNQLYSFKQSLQK